MDEPPVRIYIMASARKGELSPKNRWVRFANWPPAPQIVDYFLHEDGSLSRTAPTEASASRAYDFDPANPAPTHGGSNLTFEKGPMDQRPIGERQDYLRFQTAVLDRDVAIAGPVSLELWASTDGPDTDFMVKLVDIYPDGYEAIVLDSALRTRYRQGRHRDDIAMMTPGAPEKLTLDLWDTAITFETGHRTRSTSPARIHPASTSIRTPANCPGAASPPASPATLSISTPPTQARSACRSSIWRSEKLGTRTRR